MPENPTDPADRAPEAGEAAATSELDPAGGAAKAAEATVPAEPDPAEELKAKYREALAHKHGSSGAHKTVHGDHGEAVHSQSTGPTQKMFRRKAGS